MNLKNTLLSVTIAGVLLLCGFNSVTAAPAPGCKFTSYNQDNHAASVNGREETSIVAAASPIDPFCPGTKLRLQVGSPIELFGVLSPYDIPKAILILQRLNVGNGTWSTVMTDRTHYFLTGEYAMPGEYVMYITPRVAGVSTYRVLYYGDSQHAPAVSNEITLIVTNFPSTWL